MIEFVFVWTIWYYVLTAFAWAALAIIPLYILRAVLNVLFSGLRLPFARKSKTSAPSIQEFMLTKSEKELVEGWREAQKVSDRVHVPAPSPTPLPVKPSVKQKQTVQEALDKANEDRAKSGLSPIILA